MRTAIVAPEGSADGPSPSRSSTTTPERWPLRARRSTLASALALLVVAGVLPAAAARIPQPVSPGAQSAGAVAEARCPTFQWAGISGARGYEVAVFRVSDDGADPTLAG